MKKPIKLLLLAAMPLCVVTCGTTGPQKIKASDYCPKPDPHAVCAGWKPILLRADDYARIDPRTALEIDRHNRHGMDMGCWMHAH